MLLKALAHLPFVFLVVLSDLSLALLIDFDFEATLPRPLLPQVLLQFINVFVYQVLANSLKTFLVVILLIV